MLKSLIKQLSLYNPLDEFLGELRPTEIILYNSLLSTACFQEGFVDASQAESNPFIRKCFLLAVNGISFLLWNSYLIQNRNYFSFRPLSLHVCDSYTNMQSHKSEWLLTDHSTKPHLRFKKFSYKHYSLDSCNHFTVVDLFQWLYFTVSSLHYLTTYYSSFSEHDAFKISTIIWAWSFTWFSCMCATADYHCKCKHKCEHSGSIWAC